MIRIGKVVSHASNGFARVEFFELDNYRMLEDGTRKGETFITSHLQVLYAKTQDDKYFWMPDIGEYVVCIFLDTGANGFILGAFYNAPSTLGKGATFPPETIQEGTTVMENFTVPKYSPDKWHVTFKDGTVLEYDRKLHVLKAVFNDGTHVQYDAYGHAMAANIKGKATIAIDKTLDATVSGDVTLTAGANVTAKVQGNVTSAIQGDLDAKLQGNLDATIGGNATAKVAGSLKAQANQATIQAPTINLTGNVVISGTLSVAGAAMLSGGVSASGGAGMNLTGPINQSGGGITSSGPLSAPSATIGGINVTTHVHQGVQSGPAITGLPQ